MTRTSDYFRVQRRGSPHNPATPLGGSSSSPELSFASLGLLHFSLCSSWALLQFHSCLMILVPAPPCVILTYAMTIPTRKACALSPLSILPSLLQVPCPRWKESHRHLFLPAPHPVVLLLAVCLPHDYPSKTSSTPSHPPQEPTPGI